MTFETFKQDTPHEMHFDLKPGVGFNVMNPDGTEMFLSDAFIDHLVLYRKNQHSPKIVEAYRTKGFVAAVKKHRELTGDALKEAAEWVRKHCGPNDDWIRFPGR